VLRGESRSDMRFTPHLPLRSTSGCSARAAAQYVGIGVALSPAASVAQRAEAIASARAASMHRVDTSPRCS
jgi:hypothetical protein